MSLWQKFSQIEKQSGRRPPEMDGPEMPDAAAHVWFWFQDLQRGRQIGADGPSRFPWIDLSAFFQQFQIEPRPWEIRLIRSFEDAFLNPKPPEVDSE